MDEAQAHTSRLPLTGNAILGLSRGGNWGQRRRGLLRESRCLDHEFATSRKGTAVNSVLVVLSCAGVLTAIAMRVLQSLAEIPAYAAQTRHRTQKADRIHPPAGPAATIAASSEVRQTTRSIPVPVVHQRGLAAMNPAA